FSNRIYSHIRKWIAPYKKSVDDVLDAPLAYSPRALSKNDGAKNTSMGNFFADMVLEETRALFQKQNKGKVDFMVMNHGGIRAVLPKGTINARNAYEIMPFENYISVIELSGTQVRDLVRFLVASERPHAVAGISIQFNSDKTLRSVDINGEPFDEGSNYRVATSDYLVTGGAEIGFFPEVEKVFETEYLLRNAIIDHFKAKDTLTAEVDQRFIQFQN
ncbi:MAG: 5'-nucleotidase, partial [Bacteroidota bacterium]